MRPAIPPASATHSAWTVRASGRGFTFLELVLVSAILAVLLVAAAPVYRQYLLRTHRAQAVGELIAMAACQEQKRAARGAYNTAACAQNTALAHYSMSYAPAAQESVDAFQITASPVGSQSPDRCGSLILDHTGRRLVSVAGADHQKCWSGR